MPSAASPRILIADDSAVLRDLMSVIMTLEGYSVTVAEDGIGALEELSRDPPHLIIMDIEMPRLDGCEVCRQVKNAPETRDIPVLLVSGCGETEVRALAAGADDYLDKPFFLTEFQRRVEYLLRSKRGQ
jgi:two-component system response regulator MprA